MRRPRHGPAVDGAAAPADSATSHVRLSTTLGVVAVPGRARCESQSGVSRAEAEAVVGASTVVHPRPRVRGWVSRASRSNERWAMDVTHIACGQDGWAHLAAVIDCHDRELIGYEFALRSRAKEAERAVEAACLARFGTLRPVGRPGAPERQRPDLPESAVSAGLSRLSLAAGVHHALHAGAEWDHRTILSESQGGVCLATHVSDL